MMVLVCYRESLYIHRAVFYTNKHSFIIKKVRSIFIYELTHWKKHLVDHRRFRCLLFDQLAHQSKVYSDELLRWSFVIYVKIQNKKKINEELFSSEFIRSLVKNLLYTYGSNSFTSEVGNWFCDSMTGGWAVEISCSCWFNADVCVDIGSGRTVNW